MGSHGCEEALDPFNGLLPLVWFPYNIVSVYIEVSPQDLLAGQPVHHPVSVRPQDVWAGQPVHHPVPLQRVHFAQVWNAAAACGFPSCAAAQIGEATQDCAPGRVRADR